MSGDENGVVTRTVTRGQMIQALQQLPVAEEPPQPEAPAPSRRRRPSLRRTPRVAPPAPVPHKVTCPLAEADVADLLLAHFPELEPTSLKAVKQAEAIIAERDEEIAGLRQEAATAEALIETLRARVEELEPFEPRTGGLSIAPDGSPVIDVHFPEEFARLMLGNFRWYLDKHEAPNYVHMPMTDMGSGERYWVTIGRPGGKSPHELRVAAEGDAARLRDRIAAAVTALRPLAKLKGPTVADRARVVAQVVSGLEAGDPQESAP